MVNEFEILDELQIDESELELILKQNFDMYNFPVVGISSDNAFFNRHAVSVVPDFIKWFTTSEYVIGLPAPANDKNAYKARRVWNKVVTHLPKDLKNNKKIGKGHYRVYKYKDGFAFKRYEPIGDAKDEQK